MTRRTALTLFCAAPLFAQRRKVRIMFSPSDTQCVIAIQGPLPEGTRRLGSSSGLQWGAIEAAGFSRALPPREAHLALLYLTQEDYNEAVRSLPEAEVARVAASRASMTLTQLHEMAGDLAATFAVWSAHARRANWTAFATALEDAYCESYRGVTPVDGNLTDILDARRWAATLAALEAELAALEPTAPSSTMRDLAAAAGLLGDLQWGEALPENAEPRAVLFPQGAPYIRAAVTMRQMPVTHWRDTWIVGLSATRTAEALRLPGTAVLYLSTEELLWATAQLTEAQRDRDFAERRRARTPSSADFQRRILSWRLAVIGHLAAIIPALPADTPQLSRVRELLGASKDREILRLGNLGAAPNWRPALFQAVVRLRILQNCAAQREGSELARWCANTEARVLGAAKDVIP